MTDHPEQPLHKYKGYYQNRTVDIEAVGLWPAKQKAIAHFKPRKKDEHMVSVVLVEKADGTPVPLFASNADFG